MEKIIDDYQSEIRLAEIAIEGTDNPETIEMITGILASAMRACRDEMRIDILKDADGREVLLRQIAIQLPPTNILLVVKLTNEDRKNCYWEVEYNTN